MEQLPTFTFSILVENRFGVLFNITGLFSSRGYNIERLMVVRIRNPGCHASRCGPIAARPSPNRSSNNFTSRLMSSRLR